MRIKFVLLDRDGVINLDRADSVKSSSEFSLLPGVEKAIARLNQAGILVAVITNQAVVGRGELSLKGLSVIHQKMEDLLHQKGAWIDRIYYCTDTGEQPSSHRKPAPGMLLDALKDFGFSPKETAFVGDALRDLQAAYKADCERHLVLTGKGQKTQLEGWDDSLEPVHVHSHLSEAVDYILRACN